MPHAFVEPVPIVVLISGTGSILTALIEAAADPEFGVVIAAVGADRGDIPGLLRARAAGVATFVVPVSDYPSRTHWDEALAEAIEEFLPRSEGSALRAQDHVAADLTARQGDCAPRWVITAGFMKILGPAVLDTFTVLNTHPALLPAFPGAHAVRDALAYGVQVSGATVHLLDAGMDTGPIVAQQAVPVHSGDDEESLHERIKVVERELLVNTAHRIIVHGYSQSRRKVTLA